MGVNDLVPRDLQPPVAFLPFLCTAMKSDHVTATNSFIGLLNFCNISIQ